MFFLKSIRFFHLASDKSTCLPNSHKYLSEKYPILPSAEVKVNSPKKILPLILYKSTRTSGIPTERSEAILNILSRFSGGGQSDKTLLLSIFRESRTIGAPWLKIIIIEYCFMRDHIPIIANKAVVNMTVKAPKFVIYL